MILTALLAGTALAGSADGIDHEVSYEISGLNTSDPTFEVFSDSDLLSAPGIRLGYGISENLTVVGGWNLGRYRSEFEVDADSGYTVFDVNLTTHQLRLGAKADLQVLHWLRPYVTLQGIGMLGRLSIDEYPGDDDDEIIRYGDTAFGGLAAAGIDLVPGDSSNRLHVGGYLEMGYGRVLPMQFEDTDSGNAAIEIGDLDFQGFAINAGVGVRF